SLARHFHNKGEPHIDEASAAKRNIRCGRHPAFHKTRFTFYFIKGYPASLDSLARVWNPYVLENLLNFSIFAERAVKRIEDQIALFGKTELAVARIHRKSFSSQSSQRL